MATTMETIASQPIPSRRLVVAFDPGAATGYALVKMDGRDITDAYASTIRAGSPLRLALEIRDRLLWATSDRAAYGGHLHIAIEGWTWYGGSSERARGLPPAAYASGFVAGLAEMFRCEHATAVDEISTLTRPMILRALGLPSNTSKVLARERVRLLIPQPLRKCLDGASEHAYDAVAVALAADALLANPLAAAKPRRGRS